MPWFPDPNGGPPIQAPTNPNPAGGSYGLYSAPDYNGPPPPTGGDSGGGGGGGSSGGSSGGGAPPPPTPAGTQTGANIAAGQLLLNQAQQAAYQAYLTARLQLDTDTLAFQKAQEAFNETIETANVTGVFNGQPTLAAQLQQANLTGMYNGQPTLAAQQQQQQTALGYLNLISGLQGPQDYGQYLRTLGSTPGGLRDLVSAAAGKYVPAAGATTGVAPVAQSLSGLLNSATSGQSGDTSYQSYQQAAQGLPAPNQISPDAWNRFTTSQKQLLLGMYGQAGYNLSDVSDLYRQSLPNYQPSAAGTVKLQ